MPRTYSVFILIFACFSLIEAAPRYLTAYSEAKTLKIKSRSARKSGSEVFPDGIVFKANLTDWEQVVLVISRLHVEKNCNKHHIDVYDGSNASSPRLKRVCWNDSGSTVVSTGDRLFLKYTVEDRNTWFRVKYRSQLNGSKYAVILGGVLGTVAFVTLLILACFCYIKSLPDRRYTPTVNNPTTTESSGWEMDFET